MYLQCYNQIDGVIIKQIIRRVKSLHSHTTTLLTHSSKLENFDHPHFMKN